MLTALLIFALFAPPIETWSLPFRLLGSIRRATAQGFDKLIAWAFPRE